MLLKPGLRWVFVPAAVAMHVAAYVTLGLDYRAWIVTVVVVFVTWPIVVRRLDARRRGLLGLTPA